MIVVPHVQVVRQTHMPHEPLLARNNDSVPLQRLAELHSPIPTSTGQDPIKPPRQPQMHGAICARNTDPNGRLSLHVETDRAIDGGRVQCRVPMAVQVDSGSDGTVQNTERDVGLVWVRGRRAQTYAVDTLEGAVEAVQRAWMSIRDGVGLQGSVGALDGFRLPLRRRGSIEQLDCARHGFGFFLRRRVECADPSLQHVVIYPLHSQ